MKQFTIFNQLTAMPKRLAMVLTVLFTLGVGSMLGQTFTRISAASDLSDGDEIIFVNQAGTYACGTTQNSNNRTPVAITTSSNSYSYKSSDNVQVFIVKVNGSNYGFHNGSGYIYSASPSKNYLRTNTTASTTAPSGTAAWTLSVSNNEFTVKNASNTSYYLAFNGTSYFSQYTSGQSKPYIYKKVTSTYEIIAKSNNINYGTVSVSGTTITASPKTGYTYANPAYEVTSGTAKVTQNGNTFTVTPSSDCSIQINFAEKVKNTYIDNVQGNSTQALYDTHSAPSLTDKEPATTGTCEKQHWHFMGWVTEANKANPTDANIVKANTSVTANGTTYYAVWAKGTTTGGGSTSKQYSFDITPSNFNSTSYAANNNEKTSTAKASDGSTLSVKWTSNQVMLQSSAMQWQKSAGYIYNSTDLGTINSVTVTKSAGTFTIYYGTSKQPSSSTTVGNGYFQIKVGSDMGKTSKVTITFTKTTQGAQTTTYSDYITSCTTPSEYTVTFDANGHGTEPQEQTITSGEQATEPTPAPTATGYTFGGWYKESGCTNQFDFNTSITADITLYAKWTPIIYTVSFDNNGGTGTMATQTFTYNVAQNLTSNTFTRAGYTFNGWNTKSDGSGDSYANSQSVKNLASTNGATITLYAQWTIQTFTVAFDKNGGTGTMASQTFTYNQAQTLTANTFTRTGYIFNGWNTKSDGSGNSYTDKQSITLTAAGLTLYAQWTANTYTVEFNANGGTGSMSNQSFTYGQSQSLTANAFTRTDYAFKNWNTKSDGTGTSYTDQQSVSNLTAENGATVTLYAQWTPIYTITWLANGQSHHTQTDIEGTTLEMPSAPDMNDYDACEDKVFVGWTDTPISGTTDDEPADLFTTKTAKVEDAATTYYAVFATEEDGGGSFTLGQSGSFKLYANVEGTNYYAADLNSGALNATENENNATTFTLTSKGEGQYTIHDGSQYIAYGTSGTDLKSQKDEYLWVIDEASSEKGSWRITSVAYPGRAIIYRSSSYNIFKAYATSNMNIEEYYDIEITANGGTSYSEYVTSCVALPDPVISFVTTPADPIVFDPVNCGSTTPKAQAKTVQVNGENLQEYISVEVTGPYKIARTSSTNLSDYTTSLTLDKTNTGTINANYCTIYIISCPPAQSTDATTGTLTFTTKKGNTLTVNLSTPTVNCTQYTLTLVDRGVSTEQPTKYYAGETINEAPADPEGVCTDPIHYVFDGWAEATITNGSTEYTKVTFPYSMPNKATTLYAVYRYTDGNASENKFMSVDKEIGELESGKDYVLTGYYETDKKEYALSITEYETGKYKTKQVDVQESSTKYDDGSSYYELETTDGEIIWTIVGDDTNGYTFQNKSNNKYLNINGNNLVLGDENDHTFTIEHETDVIDEQKVYYLSLLIQPKDDDSKYLSSYYKSNASQVLFNLHTSNTLSLYLYKRAASYLYTTSPACGPMLEIISGKDIYVTSGYGTGRNTVIAQQTVEYRATRLKTQNGSAEGTAPDVKVAANGVTMGGVVTDKVKVVELTQNKELIGDKYTITGTVTVQYTPTANNLQEEIQVQLAVDYNTDAKDNFTVHARSLPQEFVIAAKQGEQWYALNADMSSSKAQPANGQVELNDPDNPTEATFAPCNTIYTFDGMVDGGNKEYMRFQGIDGKYLWAASAGNTGIQNYAKNTPTAGTIAYNWQLYTSDNETYQLQNEGNGRKLGLNKDLSFGMYSPVSTLQQDIRILPIKAKCIYNYAPTNLKVSVLKSTSVTLTWDAVVGATKYQYSTNGTTWTDAGTEPTVTINGLTEGKGYIYYIRAYHEDDATKECIDYSEITFTTADCDDVPADITYSADLTSITVTWTAVSTNCTVRLYSDEACTSVVKFADELKGSVTFSQLDRNTTYYVRVFAEGTCASPIIPVKTEDVEVDIVEWMPDGIIVDINTDETVSVSLENEVSYGSGTGQNAEELFFSKYFEGSGSLKLLAIYNGTGKDVDLSTYRIDRGSNGDATNRSKTYDLSQLGTIKNGQEIIFYSWPSNTNTEASVYTCSQSFLDGKTKESGVDANPRWILCDAKTHNGVKFETMDFSGDDPLLFYKGNTLIDVFGVSTAADRPSKKTQCEGRSEESWSAAEVTNMDYGKTEADFEDGNVPEGVDLLNPTITAYTARVIMFRKNTVVSGNDAVTKNVTDFVSLADEWEARSVCHSGGDGDLTCAAYQELGTFDYSDYYTKYESMGDEIVFEENKRNPDGTVTIPITDLYKQSCRNIRIKLSNSNGDVLTDREYKVPIMITTTQGTDGQAFLALQENLATVEVDGDGNPTGDKTNLTLEQVREICKTCDVVVRDNATLMKMADDAANDHPQVRDVYVYENSSLIVPNSTNYTINNLSLRRKEDAVASVNAYPEALKLPESAAAPISLDFRLSAESWHWFTLPYDCNISEVKWVDGSPAQYNVDWFLMTYDGKTRAQTQTGGNWKAYTGTTIKAGEGFILAINGNINNPAHTYELRFPMSKDVLVAEGTDKTVDVRAWGVETNIRPNHKGWNLVGNPYLAYYQRNNITNFEGLRLGKLVGPDPQTGYWEQTGEVPYVVVPVGAGWVAYEQVLASETDLLPFTAYFVQVGKDGTHNSEQDLKVSFDHTKLQLSATPMPASIVHRAPSEVNETEEPVIVGVALTNSLGESDKTSLVIADQYTDEYEMNADFFKWFGDYYKYYTKPVLYTIGADQGKRAFNALNEQLATQPIPMGLFAAKAGDYTFALNRRSDLSKVEEVWLHDANTNTYTNLMQNDYNFYTTKTDGGGRFTISVKLAPKVATGMENVNADKVWATTQNQQIIVNGLENNTQLWMYDAAGKLLYTEVTSNYQHRYSVPQVGTYFIALQQGTTKQTIKVVVE